MNNIYGQKCSSNMILTWIKIKIKIKSICAQHTQAHAASAPQNSAEDLMVISGFPPVVTPLLVLWVVVGWVKRKRLGVVRKRNVKSSYLKLTTMSFEALDAIFVEFNQYSLFLALIFLLFIWNQTSHYPPCLVQKSEPCHYNPDVDVTTVGSNKLESWKPFCSVLQTWQLSFFLERGAHYCLYIHWLPDWIENWNSSQSETQFYASGSGFEFSNTNMRESDQWDRKSVFQIQKILIPSAASSAASSVPPPSRRLLWLRTPPVLFLYSAARWT